MDNVLYVDIRLDLVRRSCEFVCVLAGSGPAGIEEIKSHPFFSGIQWTALSHR